MAPCHQQSRWLMCMHACFVLVQAILRFTTCTVSSHQPLCVSVSVRILLSAHNKSHYGRDPFKDNKVKRNNCKRSRTKSNYNNWKKSPNLLPPNEEHHFRRSKLNQLGILDLTEVAFLGSVYENT